MNPRRWLVVGLLGLGLSAPGCGSRDDAPVVLLVTLDTTRADALGSYGNPDARTPVLDRWARSGSLVRWAIADVPLTLPSHATLMTAVPAAGHGVRTNVRFRLGEKARTLAERFREAGFRTEAIVSTRVLRAETGIAQGFDLYDDDLRTPSVPVDPARYPPLDPGPPTARRADEAVDRALALLARAEGPRFLWLHLFDAHAVHDPPRPWERLAPDLYHAEIAAMDAQLGRLARELERPDLAGRVVLAVTADHGEGLEDHREEEHGLFVYDETVRVPLLLRGRGVPAGRLLDAQVRTVDVAPTLLELADVRGPLGEGGSLGRALAGRGPVPSDVAYCESLRPKLSHGASALKAWRTRDAKFVWAPEPELYDLAADPSERRSAADPESVAEGRARLAGLLAAIRDGSEELAVAVEAADGDDLARLRSLGYAGGGDAGGGRPPLEEELSVDGLDPKWIVDVAMAGRDLEAGRLDVARRKLRRFLLTVPDPVARPDLRPLWATARRNLALLAEQAGDAGGAADEYAEALRWDAGDPTLREGRLRALDRSGRDAEALREADAFLADRPGDLGVRVYRAMALAATGRSDDARTELEALADESSPEDVREAARWCLSRLGTR